MTGQLTKFKDYDLSQDEFYDEVFALALQGARNNEICSGLSEKLKLNIKVSDFNALLRCDHPKLTEEQNKKYGERLERVLSNARENINRLVRGRYLKLALGGIKVTSKTTVKKRMRIDGLLTENEEIQTSETESELAPNLNALATWLYQNDPVWRSIQKGEEPSDVGESNGSVDITSWIDKELEINDTTK